LTSRRWTPALLFLVCAGCPSPGAKVNDAAAQATSAAEPNEIAELLFDGGLRGGWQESGTASRQIVPGQSARVKFGNSNEWVLTKTGLSGRFGAVLFRVREPVGEGEFLEVVLGSADGRKFPHVKLKPDHRTSLGDGWTQVRVPMVEVNPGDAAFDRVVLRPFRPFVDDWVDLDKIALAVVGKDAPPPPGATVATAPGAKRSRVRVACDAKASPISPFIYGIAFGQDWSKLGATARRWGGNSVTRYNWETHFSNKAQDWFFENYAQEPYTKYFAESAAFGVPSALTVPIIGWVAKDATAYPFPVSVYGAQQKVDPYRPDVGNGVDPKGKPVAPGPPTRTSVVAPPEWIGRWVSTIRAADGAGKHSVYEYILDNEPMLWSTTHRDIHPDPLGYDELLDRTIAYGTAIRKADPSALIAGPAEWGWSGYFYSSKDLDGAARHLDRTAHGNVPLVEWYLGKLAEQEKKTGVRILDVLDVHYYPQEANVYSGAADRATQLLRLRSTRSLWDPSYVDESWIHETVRLLPRMKEWVDKNYPGRGLSLGEWSFGGDKDVTGALATAEALGRFAQFGVTSAFYWGAPPADSQSKFGYLAYRNFDGHGGRFLDSFVPTQPLEGASLFVSRDVDGKHLVLVAVNLSADDAVGADVDIGSCGIVESRQAYVYTGSSGALAPGGTKKDETTIISQTLPPWSITAIDVRLH